MLAPLETLGRPREPRLRLHRQRSQQDASKPRFSRPARTPSRVRLPARSVCSGHRGQELKCSEEEPGASAPRLQERIALAAAAAPPSPSPGASERAEEQVLGAQRRRRRARPLPKFAWGSQEGHAAGRDVPPARPPPPRVRSLERRARGAGSPAGVAGGSAGRRRGRPGFSGHSGHSLFPRPAALKGPRDQQQPAAECPEPPKGARRVRAHLLGPPDFGGKLPRSPPSAARRAGRRIPEGRS